MTPTERVDAVLRNVTTRSTVYSTEVTLPLQEAVRRTRGKNRTAFQDALSAAHSATSTWESVSYIHERDSVNILLDLRNTLRRTK